MPAEACDAIVLRRTRYSETSLVVVLFTREHGRLDALAKGCRRPKSPMRGCLDLYNRERMMIIRRSRSGLSILTETSIEQEFLCLRRRPLTLALVSVLAEILRMAMMPMDPHPRSFDRLCLTLANLDAGAPQGATVCAGWLGILADLGLAPRLDACAVTGRALPEETALFLSGQQGGLIGPWTRPQRGAVRLDMAGLTHLRQLATGAPASGPDIPPRLLHAIGEYTQQVLERPLRSLPILLGMLKKAPLPNR